MKQEISDAIEAVVKEEFSQDVKVELTRPEMKFGDYTTNVALQLAGKLASPPAGGPREIAETISEKLQQDNMFEKIEVAGPGFINITLSDQDIFNTTQHALSLSKPLENQVIVAEYSDPNPFKVLHAGHIYTTVVGDALANIFETAGATVHRVNYGGDVGLHVARTMWSILQTLGGEYPDKLSEIEADKRPNWLAEAYVKGTLAYDTDETAKAEITKLNKIIYKVQAEKDHDSAIAKIYWVCREWSYQAFDAFYKQLGTSMEKYYPESDIAELGLELVKKNIGTTFQQSDGAIVYKGEKHGLHTRVFINQQGIPTYEAKDVGLIVRKNEDYHFDKSVVITGNEQQEYMAVILKAMSEFLPELVKKSIYIPHGMVRLAGDIKMSSRNGNIITATDVLKLTAIASKKATDNDDEQVVLGAIKYSFLKVSVGGDIIYDPSQSVSLQGSSGPYLQYALVRARAILRKLTSFKTDPEVKSLDSFERNLARQLSLYPEAFQTALNDYSPHHIANYLFELAQIFNRFYENSQVAGDPREALRASLVKSYEEVLSHGLSILGMPKPDKM